MKYFSSFSLEKLNSILYQSSPLQFFQDFHVRYLIKIRSGEQHRPWGLISKIENGILKIYVTSKLLISQEQSWDECSAAQTPTCIAMAWGSCRFRCSAGVWWLVETAVASWISNISPGDVTAAASGHILRIERLENRRAVSLFRCLVVNASWF